MKELKFWIVIIFKAFGSMADTEIEIHRRNREAERDLYNKY